MASLVKTNGSQNIFNLTKKSKKVTGQQQEMSIILIVLFLIAF